MKWRTYSGEDPPEVPLVEDKAMVDAFPADAAPLARPPPPCLHVDHLFYDGKESEGGGDGLAGHRRADAGTRRVGADAAGGRAGGEGAVVEADRDQLEEAALRHPASEVFYRWLRRQPRDDLWGMIEAYELGD